jgi:predicted MFS family arabinose efflux permease
VSQILPCLDKLGSAHFAPSAEGGLSGRALALIGTTCAVCVANNYLSQPLLIDIARDLGMAGTLLGVVPTLTQAGIAAGMLFLLPLGDRVENRYIVVALLLLQAAALALMAATPLAPLYLLASAVAGVCGIVTYLLPAYVTRLVPAERRGRVTGLLATGILTGIMLGRSVAGIAGYELGWRIVYAAGATATGLMAMVMARTMPSTPGMRPESYGSLLYSLFRLLREHQLLRRATLLQALSFGSFNALWVGLTLHLQAPPFSLDTRRIGELALVAVTSALAAPMIGRIADRHSLKGAVSAAFLATLCGWIAFLTWPGTYLGVVIGMVMAGLGAIGTDVTLRTALYGLDPTIRMRLNAVYSAGTFVGGGAFSLFTPLVYGDFGWVGVAWAAIAVTLVAIIATAGLQRQA